MRKWNAILTAGILVLFVIHAVGGGFQLAGIIPGGSAVLSTLARIMVVLILTHAVISTILTIQSLRAQKHAGVSYIKANRLFWTRRISGYAVFLFIFSHVILFLGNNSGAYRLNLFEGVQLATQLLLVISIAVHVISNVKPVLIALGIRRFREHAVDILFVLAIVLAFTGLAFIIYYLRWNVF